MNGVRYLSRERGNYRQTFLKKNKGIMGTGLYLCGYCFKPVTKSKMEVDHIIPFSKGGTNHISNLTASCMKCNRAKSDKIDHRIIKGYTTKIIGGVIGLGIASVLAVTYVPMKRMVFNPKTSLPTKILGIAITVGVALALYGIASTAISTLIASGPLSVIIP